MVRNVFRLDDRQIGSLMVPRARDRLARRRRQPPWEENCQAHRGEPSIRATRCAAAASTTSSASSARAACCSSALRGASRRSATATCSRRCSCPRRSPGWSCCEHFRASSAQLVFVVDEYGEVQGMITLRDVLEAITGEFSPRRRRGPWAVQRDDGSWLLDGLIPIPELKDRLGPEGAARGGRGRYNTLAGMMMLLLGRLPQTGDKVDWDGWRFEVVDLDGKRVDKVLASALKSDTPKRSSDEIDPGVGMREAAVGQALHAQAQRHSADRGPNSTPAPRWPPYWKWVLRIALEVDVLSSRAGESRSPPRDTALAACAQRARGGIPA